MTLSAMPKRESLAASAERIASRLFITSLMMVRLTRMVAASSARRCLIARGTSLPVSASLRMMKPRSACKKIVNSPSISRARTSDSPTALPRL